ncbi:MAG: 30S ribosomal protein S6 [Lachnospiraceae bacterium]|nr:30S ribosomal protein S6 [Lachnospiraceae bacterium]
MNKYELCVVLNGRLEDEARNSEIEKIKNYITRFGGVSEDNIEEWGKRKFAYEIDGMNEGYYYFIKFEGKHTTPQELEDSVRIMENVVRFLIVKQ